jgi:CubicO group peptidase (beta-lactamase class C family)
MISDIHTRLTQHAHRYFFVPALLLCLTLVVSGTWGGTHTGQEPAQDAQASFVFPGESWERIGDPETAGYSKAKLEKMTEYIESLDTTGLMVVVGGRVLYEYGDLTELSYLASVRKSVLSILYGKYVADRTILLTMTLEELGIDDIQGLLPVEKKAKIDHLITARSGIYHPASNSGDSTADAPERGSQEPGKYFLYNNWDFNCAGFIFEKLTHQTIYDAMERDLAIPLGMQDFDRLQQRKSGNLQRSRYPAYHIWLSTRDMARIGYLMLRKGNWAGRQVVPEYWTRKISRVKTPIPHMNPEPYKKGDFGYGYMWWVWDGPNATGPYEGAYTASGAYGQYITVLPALDMVLAHKTAVPPRNRATRMNQYRGIIGRLIQARMRE